MVAVRWYLRYNLSYRDVEELLAERGIEADQTSSPSSASILEPPTRVSAPGPPKAVIHRSVLLMTVS
jgi:hypothetical protein